MDRKQAIELVVNVILVESQVQKQANARRGVGLRLIKEERKSIAELLSALGVTDKSAADVVITRTS
jgi:hypothetical protein